MLQTCSSAMLTVHVPILILSALMAPVTKSATYPPPANSATIQPSSFPGWPSHSQLASAEHDLGFHVAQAEADTAHPPLWQTGTSM